MRKRKSNDVNNAHLDEQIEATSKQFLSMMQHYGVNGCLYLSMPNKEENIFVFSENESESAYKALLKKCATLSSKGSEGVDLDNTI